MTNQVTPEEYMRAICERIDVLAMEFDSHLLAAALVLRGADPWQAVLAGGCATPADALVCFQEALNTVATPRQPPRVVTMGDEGSGKVN